MGKTLGAKRKREYTDRPGRSKRFKAPLVRVASIAAAPAVSARSGMLFGPKTKTVKMLYGDTNYTLSNTGVTPSHRDFTANGLFDPDVTGGGHQPRGYDQMMAIYERYVVTGVKVEVWFSSPDPGQSYVSPLPFIMYRETSSTLTSFPDILERPNTVLADGSFPGTESAAGQVGSASMGKYMCQYFDLVKLKGKGKDRAAFLSDDSMQGTITANPSDTGIITVGWIRNGPSSVDTCVVAATVRLTYYTTFMQPVQPAES